MSDRHFHPVLRQALLPVLLLSLAATPRVTADQPADPVQALFDSVRNTFSEKKNTVVQVEGKDAHGSIRGTGFYIDALGTIYTLASIVENCDEIRVIRGGEAMPAELLVADDRSGVALIRTQGGNAFLTVRNTPLPAFPTPVMTIGYPLDMPATPGFGIISSLDRKFGGIFFSTSHWRVGIPVQRGQGGAPLLDLEGNLVGIITSSVDGGASCYAIPISAAEKVRRDFTRFGEVRHGWVGIKVEDPEPGSDGARICELETSAPAAGSGIEVGDILMRIGGHPIKKPEDVLDASFHLTEGDKVHLTVLRDGEVKQFEVVPGRHPASSPALQAGWPRGLNLLD